MTITVSLLFLANLIVFNTEVGFQNMLAKRFGLTIQVVGDNIKFIAEIIPRKLGLNVFCGVFLYFIVRYILS